MSIKLSPFWGFRLLFSGLLFFTPILALSANNQDKEETEKPSITSKLHGRLPPHYGKIVNDQQRQKIYAIQEEYRSKIEVLENQLKALKKERDEKIASVLTPEQRQAVALEAAQAKKKKTDKKVIDSARSVITSPQKDLQPNEKNTENPPRN